MADAVVLQPATTTIVTGGTAIITVPAAPKGGLLQNPQTAADQSIASPPGPELLYIDPINVPGSTPGSANGTCFALYPGQTWTVIAGQTTPTRANAHTSGHKFSGIWW